jgi:hypothetical protein
MISASEAKAAHDLALLLDEEEMFARHEIRQTLRTIRPAVGLKAPRLEDSSPSASESKQPGRASSGVAAGVFFLQGSTVEDQPHKLRRPGAIPGPAPFPTTEQPRACPLPAVDSFEVAPEGPGTGRNKPLMRNGARPMGASATGNTAGSIFPTPPTAPAEAFAVAGRPLPMAAAGAASGDCGLLCPWCLWEGGTNVVRSELVRVQSCARHGGDV